MSMVVASTERRAAQVHRCDHCYRAIGIGTLYLDMRCVGDGSAWTNRMHVECDDAYCSWQPDEDVNLLACSDGHIPPCPLAWAGNDGATCACPLQPGPNQPSLL